MKLFETVDDKLNNIGFVKVEENKYGVEYERKKDLMDEAKIGNVGVGLTGYEMKLFLKKMKQIGLYSI